MDGVPDRSAGHWYYYLDLGQTGRWRAAVMRVEAFRDDVLSGLKHQPKQLHPKYFYDENGTRLFQRIMEMPEYYLTDCELEIFREKTAELAKVLHAEQEPFDLIELGAGDATKSSFLLQYLVREQADFTYMPIDICERVLLSLRGQLDQELPELPVVSLHGEYLDMLHEAAERSNRRK